MSVTTIAFVSTTNSRSLSHLFKTNRNTILFDPFVPTCRNSFSKPPYLRQRFSRIFYGASGESSISTGFKPFFPPVMEWQDCTVKMEINVPISVAYKCYSDREAIPKWMPFISSVKILEDKPDLSRWSLKYEAFGQNIEYSWLARNMQPITNQKIHWRSLEGLPNRGAVRFFPKGPESCIVELTVSYEVPQLLVPVASALQPFLEGLLKSGLERFATFAKSS
ncbi:hypothetical protein HS088_TW18G00749 [Tripterygium wilfordii]|uniref:Coenzyme Q-binding protein COQ10 START domain-containing protein n=1 Tax=Tripterygium wilfordii TaxID=458696 RepID=A0A7J7CD93_TRIWF|nr:uncharacterized protein LOC119984767 [Tripterygium wilfordii]KAF5732060.1 hypothetical protein HS088_TW18G00749 [Tripterygium wilfordii]